MPRAGHPKIVPPESGQERDWFNTAHDFSLGHATPTPNPLVSTAYGFGPKLAAKKATKDSKATLNFTA